MVNKKNLDKAKESIFKVSEEPKGAKIKGYDFEKDFDLDDFIKHYESTGFQASHFHKGFEILKKMFSEKKKNGKDITVFLGYTSNLVSSGVREAIKFLVKHNLVDCIVTTAGGVEEDIIKCIKPFILGDFRAKGAMLRQKGINRIGNIFVPNDRYCDFEDFMVPILKELYESQE